MHGDLPVRPILFLVVARAGSVRLPGKNLELVDGIALVARSVRRARRAAVRIAGAPHTIVCSTDSPAIADVARAWGAQTPFLRPAEFSDATATSVAVALHALDELDPTRSRFRAVVLVQPTSPLATPDSLVRAIEAFDRTGRAVTSVHATHPAAWHVAGDPATGLARVDDLDADRILDGVAYVIAPRDLERSRSFTPDGSIAIEVSPREGIDVDTPDDLAIARAASSMIASRVLDLAGHLIGEGHSCFVIAEAGVNHNGELELAHRLVDAAADAGADAVKFQTFKAEWLAAAGAPLAAYQHAGFDGGDQRELLGRLELSFEAHVELQRHAVARGILFLSSPFDEPSADLLERLGVPAFKVPSGELTNLPFLALLARMGRPLLISTGMASMVEVADAVDAVADAGDPPVALFHCVSSYPAVPADANLRAIPTLRRAFDVPVGWSDHTSGIEIPLAAVAIGADLVEKHLTLNRSLPGPDHAASLEPGEMTALVRWIRTVEIGPWHRGQGAGGG